uniref:Uncharacterized protein n=1 Tax=Setaria italica TaxID=4555 RepID=K3YAY7_SETIT
MWFRPFQNRKEVISNRNENRKVKCESHSVQVQEIQSPQADSDGDRSFTSELQVRTKAISVVDPTLRRRRRRRASTGGRPAEPAPRGVRDGTHEICVPAGSGPRAVRKLVTCPISLP